MAAGRKGEGRAPQSPVASAHFLTYFSHSTVKSCGLDTGRGREISGAFG